LFIDKLSLTTIKQQSNHPRNVILCLKDKRSKNPFWIVEDIGGHVESGDQLVYFFGRLDPTFEKFENLQVIRQSFYANKAYNQYLEKK
jgi:hypothetical protein